MECGTGKGIVVIAYGGISTADISGVSVTSNGYSVGARAYEGVSSVNVNGGKFTSTGNYSAYVAGYDGGIASMNIESGEFSGSSSGLSVSGGKTTTSSYGQGTATVGSAGNTLSSTAPSISGGNYGVNSGSYGYWYFYNGIVKGTKAAYSASPLVKRSGCTIATGTSGSYNTAYLKSSSTSTSYPYIEITSFQSGTWEFNFEVYTGSSFTYYIEDSLGYILKSGTVNSTSGDLVVSYSDYPYGWLWCEDSAGNTTCLYFFGYDNGTYDYAIGYGGYPD